MTDAPKATEPEKPHNKLDENKPAPAGEARKPKGGNVRLRTRIGEVLDLSAHGHGVVDREGREFSSEDADDVRTLARKAGVTLEVEK